MERVVYEKMAELDQRHWWYRARREVLAALIRRKARPPPARSCSRSAAAPGTTSRCSANSARSKDSNWTTKPVQSPRSGSAGTVISAPLPELEGVPERHYDLIGAFDVIEHIDDDKAAMNSIAKRLKRGGRLVVTVPAHQWMWSAHDVVNHHKRRYSKRALRQLIESSPLRLETIGYFNSLLFPLAVGERLSSKLRGKDDADLSLPPKPLNSALERAFAAERHLVGRLPLPPGLSLFAVASAT